MLMHKDPNREPPPLLPAATALFLDIDGTLLEIAATPSAVAVDQPLVALIERMHAAAGGALALISGRRIADIDALFPGLRLAVAGQHGIERRDSAGRLHYHAVPQRELEELRRRLAALAARHSGVLFEDKGATLALHYRALPHAGPELNAAVAALLAPYGEDFRLQPGKMVLEVKPAGKDKGTAVEEFMREPPFAGRSPAFLGDDVTDEYGFRVVNAAAGCSIKVGEGDSAALWRLNDVCAVREWLALCISGIRETCPPALRSERP
jgi:trehalose 6-phosphate phosphatase